MSARSLVLRIPLGLVVALLSWRSAAVADIIHLKNGGTITADSWEMKGEQLVIAQGASRITVPRSQVDRIEPSPQASPPSAESAAPTAPKPTPAPATISDETIQTSIDALKRRIDDYPLARAENTRSLVRLLDEQGARALKGRDYDAALAHFREALSYDAHDARAELGLAATYARTDQDIFARSTLERALLDHPDDPDLHALLGDVYNGQERTEEALAEWRKAYELKPNEALKAKIDKLTRERSIDSAYRQSDAAHFTLKYDGEKAGTDLGGQILDYLEGEFRSLETRFDHYPLQPIVVILYPHRQFYEATQADSNVAGLYDGKIRVPIGGLQQLNADAKHVLVHELAHAFIAGKSHGAAPRWLHEGLAQRIEGKSTSTATGLTLARQYQGLETKDGWGQDFSYPSALSFVEFLDDRVGFAELLDVMEAMGKGATADAAFEQVTRYSLKELRQAWGEALVARYLQ